MVGAGAGERLKLEGAGDTGAGRMDDVAEIKRELDACNAAMAGTGRSDTDWTREIKSRIARLGKSRSFYVCASGVESECSDHGEWLYDLCWIEYVRLEQGKPDSRLIRRLPLALECEWSTYEDHVGGMEDFQKLCQAIADLKWMIFQCADKAMFAEICLRLGRQVDAFEPSRRIGKYICSGWIWSDGYRRFEHQELS